MTRVDEACSPRTKSSANHGRKRRSRGSALIAVLWLTAVLAAITFALAANVRSEIDRASTSSDGVRAYYLATGSIDRRCCGSDGGRSIASRTGLHCFSIFRHHGFDSATQRALRSWK